MIRTVDTDVVVLAISVFWFLSLVDHWMAFGVGKHCRYIPFHQIAEILGDQKAIALRVFHALTGCNSVAAISGVGKLYK